MAYVVLYCLPSEDLLAELRERDASSVGMAPPPPDLPPEDDMEDEDVYDVPEEVRLEKSRSLQHLCIVFPQRDTRTAVGYKLNGHVVQGFACLYCCVLSKLMQ